MTASFMDLSAPAVLQSDPRTSFRGRAHLVEANLFEDSLSNFVGDHDINCLSIDRLDLNCSVLVVDAHELIDQISLEPDLKCSHLTLYLAC